MPTAVRTLSLLPALVLSLAATNCGKKCTDASTVPPTPDAPVAGPVDAPSAEDTQASAADPSTVLAAVLAGEHRKADNKARDAARHPAETLQFLGVRPEHSVVELWPGGGWYTEILAPYAKEGGGSLTVTLYDPEGPEKYYGTGQAQRMLARFDAEAETMGKVGHVIIPQKVTFKDDRVDSIEVQKFSLGEPGSVDAVLTFRNSHGWFARGAAPLVYGAAFDVLKPGGILGVVQHRAPQGSDPKETSKAGYLSEEAVIEAVTAAGFVLDEKSEINANAKDTKDYAKGVWALPPSLSEGDKDRETYVAIGESDRMTLRFIKPKS